MRFIDSIMFCLFLLFVIGLACLSEMCSEHSHRSADVEPRENWDE